MRYLVIIVMVVIVGISSNTAAQTWNKTSQERLQTARDNVNRLNNDECPMTCYECITDASSPIYPPEREYFRLVITHNCSNGQWWDGGCRIEVWDSSPPNPHWYLSCDQYTVALPYDNDNALITRHYINQYKNNFQDSVIDNEGPVLDISTSCIPDDEYPAKALLINVECCGELGYKAAWEDLCTGQVFYTGKGACDDGNYPDITNEDFNDCTSSQHWDSNLQMCVDNCTGNQHWNGTECITCAQGQHWDEQSSSCITDTPTPTPVQTPTPIPPEICNNGIDDDLDGLIDGADSDCNSGTEICDNHVDDDGDGLIDSADPDCGTQPEICNNGIDDDGDGLVDGYDPDCNTGGTGEGGGSGGGTGTAFSDGSYYINSGIENIQYDDTVPDKGQDTEEDDTWLDNIFNLFANHPLISVINNSGITTSGEICSLSVDLFGRTIEISFCDLTSYMDYFGYFVFVCASIYSYFIIFKG